MFASVALIMFYDSKCSHAILSYIKWEEQREFIVVVTGVCVCSGRDLQTDTLDTLLLHSFLPDVIYEYRTGRVGRRCKARHGCRRETGRHDRASLVQGPSLC
ncbi:hypothetical protein VTN00DRAFT_902 [Thermoascus crustaceus]|uniref:uncharacterized protein n=1 Tax=Thermoascus crustaceus TaxID=5088 RepID=UPI0037448677